MSSKHPTLVLCILALAAPAAHPQQLLRAHRGGFGYGEAGVADLDGDSIRDYLLLDWSGSRPRVQVISGASGAPLFTIDAGQTDSIYFGWSLSGAGDLDGDGVPDVLVGALDYVDPAQSYWAPGAVIACSGRDGSLLQLHFGDGDGQYLGAAVAGLDDVDGDGTPDFLAGAPNDATVKNPGSGFVRCFSGRTGAILYQVDGALAGDRFGMTLAVLSDHDGDGVRDFAVQADSETRICSGRTGATIASIPPAASRFNLAGVAEVDDLDGDGEPEIAIGEYDVANRDGEVRVISIPTQTELRTHLGDAPAGAFGQQIATISDADGDGVRDYLVSQPGQGAIQGSASLFSGRTGERLYRFVDAAADYSMGASLADLGDLDGDGRAEVVVGSPLRHHSGKRGAAFVYRGNDLWLNAEPKLPAAGDVESLIVHGAPAGNPVAVFLTDVDGTPLVRLLSLGTSDAVESFTLGGTVPSGLTGMTITLHAYALDTHSRLMSSADETILFQ